MLPGVKQSDAMGKNKGRGGGQKKNFKKDPIAVKVAGVRKSKTKAVNSSLKKVHTHFLSVHLAVLYFHVSPGERETSRNPVICFS